MKRIGLSILLLLISTYANAASTIFVCNGESNEINGLRVEVKVSYDPNFIAYLVTTDDQGTFDSIVRPNVRTGQIEIKRFLHNDELSYAFTYPLFVSRTNDDKAYSLYGIFFAHDLPSTIVIHSWEENKPFEFFVPYEWDSDKIIRGFCQ